MPIDAKAFDATTFSKNRRRLFDHEIADRFFAAVVGQAKLRRYVSSDHFSVDGTLLEAWASHKSFQPKDGPPHAAAGTQHRGDFHGERRSNETHASTTDPEARMARKSNATAAKLSYAGHLLMEHRNALLVDIELTEATGYAERDTALEMLGRLPPTKRRRTVAGDKGYDTERSSPMSASSGSLRISRRTHTNRSTIDGEPPDIEAIRESTDPQTDRGTLRLDQDHRRRTQAPLHRPGPQPSLVPHDRRRLQHHPNRRTRRHTT